LGFRKETKLGQKTTALLTMVEIAHLVRVA
jgi:hypothetical protein